MSIFFQNSTANCFYFGSFHHFLSSSVLFFISNSVVARERKKRSNQIKLIADWETGRNWNVMRFINVSMDTQCSCSSFYFNLRLQILFASSQFSFRWFFFVLSFFLSVSFRFIVFFSVFFYRFRQIKEVFENWDSYFSHLKWFEHLLICRFNPHTTKKNTKIQIVKR